MPLQQSFSGKNKRAGSVQPTDIKWVYPPRNALLRCLQIVYSIYAVLCFLVLMFIALVPVLVSPLFGKVRGGNFVYRVCKMWAIVWYALVGIRYKELYETPHDKGRQYIFVANHISYIDIPAAVRVMHQPIRILGKYEMVKYPVFGIIYRMAVVVVDRRSPERRAQSVRALKAALAKEISIFIFPEGTFNETREPLKEFYDGAFRIAIETGTPIKPILFLDTHERMHYRGFLELTPGKCRCVYLNEIEVHPYSIEQIKELREKVHAIMEEGLRRYKTYPLPLNVY
ncbi:MAG: 1-acyl-sn-glycerol-3-phosphate acyltransferase [Bacteroidota bacterium]|nr:1-acyl-sn-glycerol-3-phosphate acyltransferase [Bacteroidota bacterium]